MAENDNSLSRLELLKRGALGVAAVGGADALLGTSVAGASVKAPKPGGNLIVGIGQTFEDINVMTAFGYRWGQLMAYAMYDTLVKFDNSGRAVPLLATKWTTPDPKTTIVTIRKGVKFHDGTDMRVEDVVWSLNRINDPVKPASNNFLALPEGDLGQGREDQRHARSGSRPRSRPGWSRAGASGSSCRRTPTPGSRDLGVQPVGTGPFQYKNFVKGDRLELTKFPSYWNNGQPYLDNLTFKFLADEAAQVANFLSGDVQYLHDISVATLPQVAGQEQLEADPLGHLLRVVAAADVLRAARGRERAARAPVRVRQGHRQQGRVGRPRASRPGTRSRRARTTSARSGPSPTTPTRPRACSRRPASRTSS